MPGSGTDPIVVLIGAPGAGKTAVASHLVRRLNARHIEIGQYHDQRRSAAEIAADLASAASAKPIIFEASGVSDDFEEILEELVVRDIDSIVAALEVAPATALRRLASRVPRVPPKVGHGWSGHVDWVRTRLRLVPTDLDVDMDTLSMEDAATMVVDAWKAFRRIPEDIPSRDTVTFAQLMTWQICGREYAYRHVWLVPPTADLPPIVGVGMATHKAIAWLFAPGEARRSLADFLNRFDTQLAREDPAVAETIRAHARQVLSSFYANHYARDHLRTLAVEADVLLPLGMSTTFAGRLDRLVATATDDLEVIEFKTRESRPGSRPRVPELLQPAAYAAAVMIARQQTRAFARLHFLEQDLIERMLISERGARSVRLALHRWLTSLRRRGLDPRPGYHCRHCRYRLVCPASASPTATTVNSVP